MKRVSRAAKTARIQKPRTYRPRVECLEQRRVLAAFIVNSMADTFAVDLTSGKDAAGNVSLRSAIQAANSLKGTNTISVPAGTYLLAQGTLDIDNDLSITGAPGAKVDAQKLSGVFTVSFTSHATIANLTIQNGQTRVGAGVNNSGTLTLKNDVITSNNAIELNGQVGTNGAAGQPGNAGHPGGEQAFGGGIFNLDDLTIVGCQITNNSAQAGNGGAGGDGTSTVVFGAAGQAGGAGGAGGRAYGGGIENWGTLTIDDSVISGNQARGGNGGAGGNGSAGVAGSTGFGGLPGQAGQFGGRGGDGGVGGAGGDGGYAIGGGIDSSGAVTIRGSTFKDNWAIAGSGGTSGSPGAGGNGGAGGPGGDGGGLGISGGVGGAGGAGGNAGGTLSGGRGGAAFGGAIASGGHNDSVIVAQNSTFTSNMAQGGASGFTSLFSIAGGSGGKGGNGGAAGGAASGGNGGPGGSGGNGASGTGQLATGVALTGGIHANNAAQLTSLIESCTVTGNIARSPMGGGSGNPGAAGLGGLGGIGGSGVVTGTNGAAGSSGSAGTASDAAQPGFGAEGGVYSPLANVRNSIVTGNQADSSPDGSQLGPAPAFDLVGIDAKLGPLQDNGGPTPTIALLAGSPARGAGDPALAGKSDQRGVTRSAPVDIGAFEAESINHAPSFMVGAAQNSTDESGPTCIDAWATGISPGPPDEATQTVDFLVTPDTPPLFAAAPTISPQGRLCFTPAANARGTAIVSIQAHDNGGTANGGSDTSAAQTVAFTIAKPHPWRNTVKNLDVTGDGHIVAGDALEIINRINGFGAGLLPARDAIAPPFYDTSGDQSVAPNDALDIINVINGGGPGVGEGESNTTAGAAIPAADLADIIGLLALDASAASPRVRRFRP